MRCDKQGFWRRRHTRKRQQRKKHRSSHAHRGCRRRSNQLNTKLTASEKRKQAVRSRTRGRGRRRRLHPGWLIALLIGGGLLILGVVFVVANQGSSSVGAGQAGQYPYQVGQPGPGSQAPPITLAGTDGKTFDL